MKNFLPVLTTAILLGAAAHPALAQNTREVTGTVVTDTGEGLPGATVFIRGTYIGGTTNGDGKFLLQVPANVVSSVLSVSFVGYETATDTIRSNGRSMAIVLQPSAALINEVVISAARTEENILRTGVTIDKLNSVQLSRLTHPDLITALGRQKGVDVTTSGMFMASMSTRGFSGANSERLVQMVDYMDTQSPSLNINAGNSLSLPEVDIESIEILHGPSSALYGANAFNGVVNTISKDPFAFQGLDVRLRGGSREYTDGQLRYAQKFGQKFAFKISGSYSRARDWAATNYNAQSLLDVPNNNPAGSGLGYEAVNRYGDVSNTFGATGGALNGKTVFMPGWTEGELISNDKYAHLYRIIPSLHYLVTDKIKALVEFKRAEGTTSYQAANRYRFKNFATNQYRAELRGEKWFVRGYQTQDFGANTYDLLFTGTFMQTAADPNSSRGLSYAQQYFNAYAVAYNTFLANPANRGNTEGAEQAALGAASPYQLQSGTPEFDALRKRIITDNTSGVGSQINPSSFLNEVSGQREFSALKTDFVVGGAYRQYRLGSQGQFFGDFDNKRIKNYEYGAYLQASHQLLQERLKLTGAARLDDSKNFKPVFSPRASAVYSLGGEKQHNFRVSYNEAYRSPVQQGQYLYLDLARVLLLANIENGYTGYRTAVAGALPAILRNPGTAQEALSTYALTLDRLRPERVKTWEFGYKAQIVKNVVVDVNYYNSRYRDFIGQYRLITNKDGSTPSFQQLAGAATSAQPFQTGDTRVIQVQANAAQEVKTSGSMLGITYTPLKQLNLTGNYTLNLLERDNLSEGFQTFYNTPQHKFNVGAFGELAKSFSYSVNYRWAEGYLWESSFGTGQLGSQSTLDGQLGYRIPSLHSTVQIGGSNLANSRNIQVYGGPQIGRLVYAGLTFELK